VKRIANHEMTETTLDTMPNSASTKKWGMASSHCTSGRQLAILGGVSTLIVAG
jgi:hypothetical protein